jgi:Uma2 family endonuclease
MVSTLPQPKIPLTALSGEQRVVFHNLTWAAYQQIYQALGEDRSARLTYDCGTLEIAMPLQDHEQYAEWIALFIRILVEELDLKIKSMGSTTLDYPNLTRGAEPDKAFYIQNQPKIGGKTVDLKQDPPPDLVVEVDITHTDINKNCLYASMGVPEFWRYNGEELRIYQLQNQAYAEVAVSPTFPSAPKSKLYEFLAQAQTDEVAASKALRTWARNIGRC